METKVPSIPIHEPYPKRWSTPKTFIYANDLKESENDKNTLDSVDGDAKRAQSDLNGNIQIIKGLHSTMPDIKIHSDAFSSDVCKNQGQTECQGHVYSQRTLCTPQKLPNSYPQNLNYCNTDLKKSSSENFLDNKMLDGRQFSRSSPSPPQSSRSPVTPVIGSRSQGTCTIPERSMPRSPSCPTVMSRPRSPRSPVSMATRSICRSPISPAVGSRSRSPDLQCMSPMPQISPHVSSNSVFNFAPEYTALYRAELETRGVKKRLFEERTSETMTSPAFMPRSMTSPHLHRNEYMLPRRTLLSEQSDLISAQDLNSRDLSPCEPRDHEISFYLNSPSYPSNRTSGLCDTDQFRAKRRIDLDDEYVPSPKRCKPDLIQQMGHRYINQLRSDISVIQNRIRQQEAEIHKPTNCTCAIMEKQFLEMAESAYRAVRRIDASPRGFEQFRRELIQTNEVMKESMDVLKNIRSFCEHKPHN